MRILKDLHRWDLKPEEAIKLQLRLTSHLKLVPLDFSPRFVAGADISYEKNDNHLFAAVVVIDISSFDIVEIQTAEGEVNFPYIPGLLSFRESPILLKALEKVQTPVEALAIDGQGIAHPRGFGIASHIGLLVDIPTVGIAKSILVGEHAPLEEEKGSWKPLLYRGKTVGAAVRTQSGVEPVYVSPGNKINLDCSIELALMCTTKYRIPEPTRLAHVEVNKIRQKKKTTPYEPTLF